MVTSGLAAGSSSSRLGRSHAPLAAIQPGIRSISSGVLVTQAASNPRQVSNWDGAMAVLLGHNRRQRSSQQPRCDQLCINKVCIYWL
jgi:hypothetical protein